MRTVIFRDCTTTIEVFDPTTQKSEFFDSLGEVLCKYNDIRNYVTLKIK